MPPGYIYKNATTENFRDVCENISGKDLNFFFEQWVYDELYPVYYYNFKQDTGNSVIVHILQAQDSLFGGRDHFIMPIKIKFTDTSGKDTVVTIWNDQKSQQFRIQLHEKIKDTSSSVVIDPNNRILCRIYYKPQLPVNAILQLTEITDAQLNPNPINDYLNICFNPKSKKPVYEIFDSSGKRVNKGLIKQSVTKVWLIHLDLGMYFLRIQDGSNVVFKKFIKP